MTRIFGWINVSYKQAFNLLTTQDRRKLSLLLILQVSFNLFDILGVGLVGILGSLAVSGVKSVNPGNKTYTILKYLHIEEFAFQNQVALLALLAVLILSVKSLLSVWLLRKTSTFLSKKSADVSASLTDKILSQPINTIKDHSPQEYVYALGYGINSIFLGIIATTIALVSDLSLLFIVMLGLLFIQPSIAFSSFFFFGVLGLILHKYMGKRSRILGERNWKLSVAADETLVSTLVSYKEMIVSGRIPFLLESLHLTRIRLASVAAEMQLLPSISKYIFESSVVFGALVISCIQFVLLDANHAVAALAIFIAAGSRLAPAALRVQQNLVTIRNSEGIAKLSFGLLESTSKVSELNSESENITSRIFSPAVQLSEMSFKYPGADKNLFTDLDLEIKPGEFVALIGPSGSGKTTLVDIVLGLASPDSGSISISGTSPKMARKLWPGSIAYVPQDVYLINSSFRRNVLLGLPDDFVNDSEIEKVLELVDLSEFLRETTSGLDTLLGDRGVQISGGQRQRLGISRALITNPGLLILDEATSALDSLTESVLTRTFQSFKGKTTIIAIAHRLSTIKNADAIYYVANGNVTRLETIANLEEFTDGLRLVVD